jgi:hypothetical protein
MNLDGEDDFPTVGVTLFDEWITKLYVHMFTQGFLDLEEFGTLDRDHWYMYYDLGYTPQEAFEEDLTAYGD